jgi:hypothetical protein
MRSRKLADEEWKAQDGERLRLALETAAYQYPELRGVLLSIKGAELVAANATNKAAQAGVRPERWKAVTGWIRRRLWKRP